MKNTVSEARELRKNPTRCEAVLWSRLRRRQVAGMKFRRQVPLVGFIVDFACLKAKLVIEVDGPIHEGKVDDVCRDRVLEELGYRIVRFSNWRVLQELDKVVAEIARHSAAGE